MSPNPSSNSGPVSTRRISALVQTLRTANEYHFRVARLARAAHRPTFSAKRRAKRLGLQVNIVGAVNCPHERISSQPYPIIEEQSPVAGSSTVSSPRAQAVCSPSVAGPVTEADVCAKSSASGTSARGDKLAECISPPAGSSDSIPTLSLPRTPEVDSDLKEDALTVTSPQPLTSKTMLATQDGGRPQTPLRICIKRKFHELDNNEVYAEKRPKYGRKKWIKRRQEAGIRSYGARN